MRRAIVPLVIFSIPAFAQDADTALSARDRVNDAADQEGAAVDAVQDTAPASDVVTDDVNTSEGGYGGTAQNGAPETYTVQPGDTLWTLSQRFLNNPWYWPKVWSYNPELDNPNWIRPGTVIRFYPGAQQPIVVEKEPEQDDDKFEDVEGGGFEKGANLQNYLDNLAGLRASAMRREFFVPADRLDDAGQILNSPDEKVLLAAADRAWVKLKKGGVGDTLQIFRKGRDIRHPLTGANLGALVELMGEVRIDVTGKEQVLGTITASWDPVERGDFVALLPIVTDKVVRVENTKAIKGYLVAAGPRPRSFLGDNFVVVIDKGKADGVAVGNVFTIVRVGDPYTREHTGMVDEDIGEIVVVELFNNVSSGIVTAASREVIPGDRIEMRTK